MVNFTKWEYLGTDNAGTKAYKSICNTNKFRFLEIDAHGHIKYHN